MMNRKGAVVLLSGGQDSTTVLFDTIARFGARVAAVSFFYNQRHGVELRQAKKIADDVPVPHYVIPVEALAVLGQGSLTNPEIANADPEGRDPGVPSDGQRAREQRNVFADERGLPPSFVPGRNILFFTLAAALAAKLGYDTIATGVCEQDRSGYPDCRAEFVGHMSDTIRLGFAWREFGIYAPLLALSKADTFKMADDLGVLDTIVEDTHTCYEGDREHRHDWGYGCGTCGACVERAHGFDQYLALATIG